MIVLFLHGPPAVGKLTVAEELSKLTGIQLFHNHIVVDAALEKFEFGSDGFKKYRAEAWLEAFETAAQNNKSFIFTFNPEKTVDPALIHQLVEQVEKHDGSVLFIELKADHNTLPSGSAMDEVHGKGMLRAKGERLLHSSECLDI